MSEQKEKIMPEDTLPEAKLPESAPVSEEAALTALADAILATDPRDDMYRGDIRGSIRDYMEEYDISDVYFVTCSYTSLDGYVFQDRLERLFDNDFAAAFDKG